MRLVWVLLVLLAGLAPAARADGVAASADGFEVAWGWRGQVTLRLPLTAPVPWRVEMRADPPRLVVLAEGADWRALTTAPDPERLSLTADGDRLIVALDRPMVVATAQMAMRDGGAVIDLHLRPGDPSEGTEAPVPAAADETEDAPLVVALDPGHGGHDPGAEGGGTDEAALMLTFADELAATLRSAGHGVVLTRETDRFLGLRRRPSAARAAGADVFLSLHADAVAGGGAAGATIYTLSDIPSDALSAEIVARQGHDDLIGGVDLDVPGDEVARILVEMARTQTAPRADALADALVASIDAAGIALHKRPRLGGAFTVLKAPDMPSVLVELGFMSDPGDVANLLDPGWRAGMAQAIADGVTSWADEDRIRSRNRLR